MKRTFQAKNITCQNCANTIKAALEDEFGEIVVNLDKDPKEVSLFIQTEDQEKTFKEEMADIGFEITAEVR